MLHTFLFSGPQAFARAVPSTWAALGMTGSFSHFLLMSRSPKLPSLHTLGSRRSLRLSSHYLPTTLFNSFLTDYSTSQGSHSMFTQSLPTSPVEHKSLKSRNLGDFPGGTVVKNLPANAGDTASSPGPGISHMPRSS